MLEPELLEQTGPIVQVISEAIPGAGVRRVGEDMKAESTPVLAGKMLGPLDVAVARAIGLERLAVRCPRLRIVNVPATNGVSPTAQLVAEAARHVGADVICIDAAGRDATSVANELDVKSCDMLLTIGGTGIGRADATIGALAARNALLAHGVALQPGRTAAIGRIGRCPIVALPGSLDQALAHGGQSRCRFWIGCRAGLYLRRHCRWRKRFHRDLVWLTLSC